MPDYIRIQIGDQIRELLGPEFVARIAEISLTDVICPPCQELLTGTVNMVVRTNDTFTHTTFVHEQCGPSEVIVMGDDFGLEAPEDGINMSMTTAVVDHDGQVLPVLVAETTMMAYRFDGGRQAELTNSVTSLLLGWGFSLISRISQPPPQVAEWAGELLLTPDPAMADELLIRDANGGTFYAGSVALSRNWLTLAAHYGGAVLYVGDVGLADAEHPDRLALQALRAAAQTGRLVGACIAMGTPAVGR